ncbi:MAG TPA: S9 family peptidase [Pyrinomonadaceae bacterium]|nr:S9 family peptidase [Pyrinomonadaceae bacterium]
MRSALSILLLILSLTAVSAFAQKRSITEKDLFNFVWVADPQLSPDGASVAFVKVTVNEKKDGYNTSVWVVSTASGESRQLTNGIRDSSPRWSPDGKYLMFVRSAEKDGRPEPAQLYMLAMSGGESFQFTTLPRGAGNPQWSPDGTMISFLNGATAEELAKAKPQATPSPSPSPSPKADEKRESDVRVITRAVYRSNGSGYIDSKHPQHIWVVKAPLNGDDKVTPRQLTSSRYDDGSVTWGRDGATIYFTSDQRDETFDIPKTDIYSIAVSGGQPAKLTSFDMGAGNFAISPNGKQLAFIGSVDQSTRSYSQPDLWVMDLTPGAQPKNLTRDFDYDVGSGVGGDNTAPRGGGGNQMLWSPDGKSITTVVGKEGKANVTSFDSATGKQTEITTGNQAIVGFRATSDRSKFVYLISTPTKIGDLYFVDKPGGEPKQITHFNQELFSKLNLTEPDEIWYQSFDGKRVQAWVQKPPDFDPNKKYPLILNIHGGPHSAYGFVFDHEFQWMAAKGYVVLYPNPRGSTTYGQDFGNIIQYHYPGDDYKDLMAGVDEVIKRGYIDTTKLGVTGGSGGGLLTNWTIGQTDRFAAAVSQRDIADWADWWYTADFTLFQKSWFRAAPFEDPEDFKARSPLTYIKNVKTPLMLILGEADYRTPPTSGGEEMFRALKYRKIPTVMVRFPNESHELSRSGQPWHRIERLQHIVGWFDRWLMGVAKPEYEVAGQ